MADQIVDQMAAPAAAGKGKVLITGATTFIGFRTVVSTLEAGYQVLAAVPKKEDIDRVLAAPSIKRVNPGAALSFLIVPDITAADALKHADKKTLTSIIHCDSPQSAYTPLDRLLWESRIMTPIAKAKHNVFNAANEIAYEHPEVKPVRVVNTSSMTAFAPYSVLYETENSGTSDSYGNYKGRQPGIKEELKPQTAMEFLAAARYREIRQTREWMQSTSYNPQRNIEVVNMMPALIIGHDELAKTTKQFLDGSNQSSNFQVLRHLRGEKVLTKLPSQTVHIDDVARAHTVAVKTGAADIAKRGGAFEDYFWVTAGGTNGTPWNKAKDIMEKDYKVAVGKGWLSLEGKQPNTKLQVETFPKETFGFEFANFDKQIRSMLDQWVALSAKEGKN
ncbi:MAG: hypothetical protein Q9221_005494 [Calogaya cf. arnoldii]